MSSQPTEIPDADVNRLTELYDSGQYIQAYEHARRFGPMELWLGTSARLIGGRLATLLGAPRLGRRIHLQAYRHDPTHPEARYYFVWAMLGFRGPLAAWRVLEDFGDLADVEPETRADLFALRSRAACLLRDFETAGVWLAEAEKLVPARPWLAVERSFLLQNEDRYEDAMASARQSLQLRAWYRPGVQSVALGLQLLGRSEEAMQFLQEADRCLECGSVVAQLASLQVEAGRYAEARKSWGRYADLSPMIENELVEWLASRRCDAAYLDGDFNAAVEFARLANHPLYHKMAERLPGVTEKGRVQLSVGFVRQHHMTCVPATLSAISRFWKMPVEHLAVAEAICYDGTPAHSERYWAEQEGWTTREFKVTWESAVALIDCGVPFTLTTVEPGNSHLQAVVGYDKHRGSLIIRDPYFHELQEFHAENTVERYRASGPRGMALVPRSQAGLLKALVLPEADLYDSFYGVERALSAHDRNAAVPFLDRMNRAAADCRLTLNARRSLAAYDANQTETLAIVEKLIEQFPDDANLQLSKVSCLRNLARRDERVAWLKEICDRKISDPLLWQEYAWELSADARQHGVAIRWLRRTLRFRPTQSSTLYLLGNLLWMQRDFARATGLYRFAACLDDKREDFARAYFSAARHLKLTAMALGFLTDRFRRSGKLSSLPAMTLFWAHSQLDQMNSAFLVLESAMELRPHDADLRLFAADAHARYGNFQRGESLLREAEGRSRRAFWLRTAAGLSGFSGDPKRALALWRELLDAEPLAIDVNRAVAQHLAEAEGRVAALKHLEQVCARFPHHFALHQLWNEWLREDGGAATEPVVRKLIEINPADAWARRELALALAGLSRNAEALTEADLAIQLEPNNTFAYSTRAWVQRQTGDVAGAQSDYRRAITLSVDNDNAINGLLEVSDSLASRREAVNFIERELIRQVVFGDGLLAYRDVARSVVSPEELLASLRLAHRERPDLWHAWSALVQQLTGMRLLDEALDLATEATGRFPLLPRTWIDLSKVHRARLDRQKEIEALEEALEINPGWGFAARELALALERSGGLAQARGVLERAVARSPLDAFNHGCLADVVWKLGEKKTAVDLLQHALRLNPDYDWCWRTLREWSKEISDLELPVRMARDLTVHRAGETRSWMKLAGTLERPEDLGERLAALDRAQSLSPRSEETHDLRAVVLAEAGRFDEAAEACRSPVWGGEVPTSLRARAAWIWARRGKITEAIRGMRGALVENPGLYWAWRELAEWLWSEGAYQESLEAAQKMAWLDPLSAVPLVYVGDVKLRLGDRAGAKADFRRALELEPQYAYAGLSLFDCELEDDELTEAQKTLNRLRDHASPELMLMREARLASRQANVSEALRALRALCLWKGHNPWTLHTAMEVMVQMGWDREVDRLLDEVVDLPDANAEVGSLWVARRAARNRWWCQRKLDQLKARGEIGRRAIITYIEQLGEHCQSLRARRDVFGPVRCRLLLRLLLRKHRDWIRTDDLAWGKLGYTLISFGSHRETVNWLGDWHGRKGAEPWMLHNLVLALHQRGLDASAGEVVRHVAGLPGREPTIIRCRLWAAIEEALGERTASANELVLDLQPEKLDDHDRKLHSLVTVLLEFQPADQSRRPFTKIHRKKLGEFLLANQHNRSMRRVFHRSVRLISRRSKNWWPLLWGYSRRYRSILFMVAVAIGVFAAYWRALR
jgi:tetratricopeptide (TPR) repeat protein